MADPRPMRIPRLKKAALAIIAGRESVAIKAMERYQHGTDTAVIGLIVELRRKSAMTEEAAALEAARLIKAIGALKARTSLEFFMEMVRLTRARGQELIAQSEEMLAENRADEAACARCAGFEARYISEQLSQLIPAVT